MSRKLLAYSGITTKVKAMEGRLLSIEDFQALANADSTNEFITYLKNLPGYSSFFANLNEHELHRGEIERILFGSIYYDYTKIYRFATIKQRKLLSIHSSHYEINVLKLCLQNIFNKENTATNLSNINTFFKTHSELRVEALAESQTLDEFISNLKGTEYYSLFVTLQNTHHETLFDYQMQLDIYYFKKTFHIIKKHLKGNDYKVLSQILGKEIDLLNILWIYRSKKYYDVDAGNIYSYIIPINFKLSKDQITKLVEANSVEEFKTIVENTYYYKAYNNLEELSFESLYYKILETVYKVATRMYPYSIAPVIYYLFRKSKEVDQLTTVLECIRYKLEPNETMNYILQ